MTNLETIAGDPLITVERNVELALPDGVVLRADIYRPESRETLPVLLIRIPYDKTGAENVSYSHPAWYARQGYIVVSQDTRGRYASDGDWYPFRYETDDGLATIEWARKLPGANGRVGMYGFSYGGATQLLPARYDPDGLEAICPIMTGSQYYEGWTYRGGALSLGFAASWAMSLGPNTALRRGDALAAANFSITFSKALDWHWWLPLDSYGPLNNEDTQYFFDWVAHPSQDDYWEQWNIEKSYDQFDTPALHVAGWYDIFLEGTIRNFNGLRKSSKSERARNGQKLIIGPWYHLPWRPLAGAPEDDASPNRIDDWQTKWFDQFLKGKETGILESRVSVMAVGDSIWRNFGEWPPAESRIEEWYLHSNGRANSRFGDGALNLAPCEIAEPVDLFTYDPSIPMQSVGGHSCCFAEFAPMGPADQADLEQWNGTLVYTAPPASRDFLIIGNASLVLHASTTAVDTDWNVRLNKVDHAGISVNLKEGILRARYRKSLSQPELLRPCEVVEYEIDLGAVGALIRKSERLRILVSSSDFPQWDRNLNTGGVNGSEGLLDAIVATQAVYHDPEHPSHLRLPVVELQTAP